jgi:hypothetical protein
MRRALPWLSLVVLAVVVYDGYVFYSRWKYKRDSAREQARVEAAEAQRTVDLLGGDQLRILDFYSTPGIIHPGAQATICYGVNAAKSVRIQPATEKVWPAVAHCLQVSPREDTEYKLTAEDGKGHSVTQSFVLRVAR